MLATGNLVGTVDLIDQEDSPTALERLELRPVAKQPDLLDRNLTKRSVGRKGQKIRMRGEHQRLVRALVGRKLLTLIQHRQIRITAEIVLFDQRPGRVQGIT